MATNSIADFEGRAARLLREIEALKLEANAYRSATSRIEGAGRSIETAASATASLAQRLADLSRLHATLVEELRVGVVAPELRRALAETKAQIGALVSESHEVHAAVHAAVRTLSSLDARLVQIEAEVGRVQTVNKAINEVVLRQLASTKVVIYATSVGATIIIAITLLVSLR